MNPADTRPTIARLVVSTAAAAVCVFAGAWALSQLNAPMPAFYALVAAFTFVALLTGTAPLMAENWLPAITLVGAAAMCIRVSPPDTSIRSLLLALGSHDLSASIGREAAAPPTQPPATGGAAPSAAPLDRGEFDGTPSWDKALLIAVNLARSGVSRDAAENVLRETLAIGDTAAILDEAYAPSQAPRSGK